MKFKPLHDKVVVEIQEQAKETKTAGGIIIPGQEEKKPSEGLVKAVGSGYRNIDGVTPLDVQVGQTVVFNEYAGKEIKIEGKEYLVMSESDIVGIML